MKKIIVFMLFLVLLLSLAHSAPLSNHPEISATLLSQDPDPVEPGQVVKVKFKIENEGKETTTEVIAKIQPNFPFTIYNDKTEKNIGKLRASSTGADAAVVEFRLKVDEKAVEGDTEIELLVQYDQGAVAYTDEEFMIDIQTHDAVLDIVSIKSEPAQIAPGETATVSIMVKNLADSLLKDIRFKLGFEGSTVPLAPYQTSSERRIAQLQTNYQNSLNFQIIADPDATPGLYKIPLNITYNDEKGNSYQVEDVLALSVGETPQVRAYIKKSDVLQSGKAGKVTIEVANAGTTDIKFLELKLLPSDSYQLVTTSDYFYLGDVDSDDTESEELNLFINKKMDKLSLPVQLKYYDANNRPYQQQFNLEMNLYSSSQLKQFGVIKSNNTVVYLILLVLIVAGVYLYRLRKKNPEKFSRLIRKIPFLNSKKK